MNKIKKVFPLNSFYSVSIVFLLSLGCSSNKKLTEDMRYFKQLDESKKSSVELFQPRIEKGDVLFIGVSSSDQSKTDQLLNPVLMQNVVGTNSINNTTNTLGYMVDNDGYIDFPLLGKLFAYGKTKAELSKSISEKLLGQVQDPIVNVRFLNYRITVIGEVARPGTYSIPNERVSILEAIGLAGDLTPFGRRNNVLVIREANGLREYARIDLGKTELFESPYFYLKQNDVLYVDVNDRKIPNTDQTTIRNVNIITGIISAVGIIVTAISVIAR